MHEKRFQLLGASLLDAWAGALPPNPAGGCAPRPRHIPQCLLFPPNIMLYHFWDHIGGKSPTFPSSPVFGLPIWGNINGIRHSWRFVRTTVVHHTTKTAKIKKRWYYLSGPARDNPISHHFRLHALVTDIMYQVCSDWGVTITGLAINRKFYRSSNQAATFGCLAICHGTVGLTSMTPLIFLCRFRRTNFDFVTNILA